MIIGYFVCHICKHCGSWNTLARTLVDKKRSKITSAKDFECFGKGSIIDKEADSQWKQIKNSTCLISSLPEDLVADIFRNFKLAVSLLNAKIFIAL